MTSDPHQRIYDARVSLRSLGIEMSARGYRLRSNYRSMEEIPRWSRALLGGEPVADLTGDDEDNLAGHRSLLHGAKPESEGAPTELAEAEAVVRRIPGWVAAGVDPTGIAVCARFRTRLTALADKPAAAGVPIVRVRDGEAADGVGGPGLDAAQPEGPGAPPCSRDRCHRLRLPLRTRSPQPTSSGSSTRPTGGGALLAVREGTRAREALYVSYGGRPSAFLR